MCLVSLFALADGGGFLSLVPCVLQKAAKPAGTIAVHQMPQEEQVFRGRNCIMKEAGNYTLIKAWKVDRAGTSCLGRRSII